MDQDSVYTKRACKRACSRPVPRWIGLIAAAVSSGVVSPASAAPPAFPDNIVVFPDRDFVTLEGFQNHVGETATVEVVRAGQVVGSAQGVVEQGDVAFEINHPGGYCWGAGTGVAVTPDIVAGDVVQIRFGGAILADTVVADAAVDRAATLNGTTVTIVGRAKGVNPAFLEQRVVNPDLIATDIARRDIRAVPGPLTRAPRGGYSSMLEMVGDVATATYVFDTAETAAIVAAGGGYRMMSWQEEDADANRQGLTISELGELGGPGMGGCPPGPSQIASPPPGAAAAVRSSDRTSMMVTWTASSALPGAPSITGYSVLAIAVTAQYGQQQQLGARTAPNATSSLITGLSASMDYSVEVRALSGTQLGAPLSITTPSGGSGTSGTPNATFAAPVATLGTTGVVLTAAANTEIYYTMDGTEPRVADMPSELAALYRGPIAITAPATLLKFFAMDATAAFSDTGEGVFEPTAPQAPAAPSGVTAIAGDGSATVTWVAPTTGPTPTAYRVTATPRSGSLALVTQEAPGGATSLVLTRLINGSDYDVVVAGLAGTLLGAASDPPVTVRPVAPATDRLTITSASWKSGDFKVVGTGSITGAQVTVYRANADNTVGAAIPNTTVTVTAPVAPANVGDYSLRVRNAAAPATNPGRIFVKSDRGGIAGPFTVRNN